MARPAPKLEPDDGPDPAPGPSWLSAHSPARIAPRALRKGLVFLFPPATTRTVASHLVPLLVSLSLIPLVLFFSLFSGWYVWKTIPAAWQIPVYLQYGDAPSPYAELSLPPLSTVQPYDISIHLVLPASEANYALGNFMATLSLSTPSNDTLITVSRPAIALPPKRPAFLFSAIPSFIDLDVPLLSSYVPRTSHLSARIDLGRRDGWKSLGNGGARELSVWNAALRGAVRRHGVRGLVSRFPLISALLASTTFFSLSLVVLAACILPAIQWPVPTQQTLNVFEPKEDRPVRVRKRPRKSAASEGRVTGTAHKFEDIIPVDVPSTHASDGSPLKRRRSRMSDVLLDSEN